MYDFKNGIYLVKQLVYLNSYEIGFVHIHIYVSYHSFFRSYKKRLWLAILIASAGNRQSINNLPFACPNVLYKLAFLSKVYRGITGIHVKPLAIFIIIDSKAIATERVTIPSVHRLASP